MAIDSLRKGGRERRMIELIKGLKKEHGIPIELVTFSSVIAYPEIYDLGMPVHILERKPKKDPRVFFRFHKICKRFDPDIVHCWGTMASVYAIPTTMKLGVKLINANIADAPHGMGLSDKRLLRAKLTFPFSDRVLANSHAGLQAYGPAVKKSKCIHNGFDFRRIAQLNDSEEVRKQWGISTPKVIGMVGALEDRKDYVTYIKAAVEVLKNRNDVTFLLIGDGTNRPKLEAMVPAHLKDRILFTGNVNQVENLINVFDIGVLSTNQSVHGEGISNSIMEYMALGKPVIATDTGGTSEIVVHKNTGFLITDNDYEQLGSYIQYLLNHPDVAQDMGNKGQERVHDHFNIDKMTQCYFDLYQEVLAN